MKNAKTIAHERNLKISKLRKQIATAHDRLKKNIDAAIEREMKSEIFEAKGSWHDDMAAELERRRAADSLIDREENASGVAYDTAADHADAAREKVGNVEDLLENIGVMKAQLHLLLNPLPKIEKPKVPPLLKCECCKQPLPVDHGKPKKKKGKKGGGR